MVWNYPRFRFVVPREARWWPDAVFFLGAVAVTSWVAVFRQNWTLGLISGFLVLSLNELLWYILVWRKRSARNS